MTFDLVLWITTLIWLVGDLLLFFYVRKERAAIQRMYEANVELAKDITNLLNDVEKVMKELPELPK